MTPLFNTWRVSDRKKTIRRPYLPERSGEEGGGGWARLAPFGENERKSDLFVLATHKPKGHVVSLFLAGVDGGHKVQLHSARRLVLSGKCQCELPDSSPIMSS